MIIKIYTPVCHGYLTSRCKSTKELCVWRQRKNLSWINERSHEAYARNYDIAYPHDEHLSGRNLKTDPFHNVSEVLCKNFHNFHQQV